ncbi:hypothetical protein CRD60_02060 [Bifidobacterium aemilianum]|uniref:Tripartite tricarboxylate transporter TctB family protein n=1 Tax=Bifidobacterium aemilianum TaxID=2493120 RepID=A0A366K9I4_9BIFI|nr:tripartite tricarboxylate transporter TctB family protein [Bifidobacterium aemilianum]RBP97987.1 hypothetical protein CRD60_02060 [Bifidobacterium aemilianum]
MVNRAERRAQAKRGSKGVPSQYDQTQGRARSGMVDEYSLQERSRRLEEHAKGEWKPSSSTIDAKLTLDDINSYNPERVHKHRSLRQWLRLFSWILISLSAIAFIVVMWLPKHPIWLVITVSAVFAVGVLGILLFAGGAKDNPNLDEYGTAI